MISVVRFSLCVEGEDRSGVTSKVRKWEEHVDQKQIFFTDKPSVKSPLDCFAG